MHAVLSNQIADILHFNDNLLQNQSVPKTTILKLVKLENVNCCKDSVIPMFSLARSFLNENSNVKTLIALFYVNKKTEI